MDLTKKLVLEGSAQTVITISYKKCDKKATIIFSFPTKITELITAATAFASSGIAFLMMGSMFFSLCYVILPDLIQNFLLQFL